MINSRKLEDLRDGTRAKAEKFVRQCASVGIDVLITSTYRDNESQGALYAQGRSTPGPRVTNARPGESFHNYRIAFDFVPIVAGKAQWNDEKTFTRCGEIGEACGLEWAGRWRSFKEMAHFQEPGLSIAALKAGA